MEDQIESPIADAQFNVVSPTNQAGIERRSSYLNAQRNSVMSKNQNQMKLAQIDQTSRNNPKGQLIRPHSQNRENGNASKLSDIEIKKKEVIQQKQDARELYRNNRSR